MKNTKRLTEKTKTRRGQTSKDTELLKELVDFAWLVRAATMPLSKPDKYKLHDESRRIWNLIDAARGKDTP